MQSIVLMDHRCYVAIGNTDCNEGRGGSFPIIICETRQQAESAAKGKGVMGYDAPVKETIVDVIVPDGDWTKAYTQTLSGNFSKLKIEYVSLKSENAFVDCTYAEAVKIGIDVCKVYDGNKWLSYNEWSTLRYEDIVKLTKWKKPR